ncbi:DNA cytosine methyltransferase [Rhizobium pusense]|uniref:DNA cytosine methyltransferase n=1 Tax=Agrobacterium pusense TaxID=648995 RepID=UPI002446CF6E|nr:DNA cytosine methyltransferase [Agrobacterium pusense]MDH1266764.1 DNA cytosine methyltransferase [Agrobacterium pusense]
MVTIGNLWAIYNENDDYAADWLENLIARRLIAPGIVDRRSVEDLLADDIRGFRQVHLFAGIGVWSHGLRRAGVPDDASVWTCSCPCQPFSAAGKGAGMDDERHLWPAVLHLLRECRPDIFLGEQVASSDGLGWLDLVQTDLEAAGYAIGAVDTCSAGSGAPHIRQRLRFSAYDTRHSTDRVQHPSRHRWNEWRAKSSEWGAIGGRGSMRLVDFDSERLFSSSFRPVYCGEACAGSRHGEPERLRDAGGLDDSLCEGLEGLGSRYSAETGQRETATGSAPETGEPGRLAHDDDDQQRQGRDTGGPSGEGIWSEPCGCDELGRMADADPGQFQEKGRGSQRRVGPAGAGRLDEGVFVGRIERAGPTNGFWRDADWLFCRDGKWRPVEPCTFPLVDGAAFRLGSGSAFEGKSRQGMLKGYGNAVDAEATRVFIEACADFFAHLDARRVTAELLGDLL